MPEPTWAGGSLGGIACAGRPRETAGPGAQGTRLRPAGPMSLQPEGHRAEGTEREAARGTQDTTPVAVRDRTEKLKPSGSWEIKGTGAAGEAGLTTRPLQPTCRGCWAAGRSGRPGEGSPSARPTPPGPRCASTAHTGLVNEGDTSTNIPAAGLGLRGQEETGAARPDHSHPESGSCSRSMSSVPLNWM